MKPPNHYDTLGIRPNASTEEIELAFKGRRSQYHPDRYTQSDAATLQWATDQMKSVNVAYETLSSQASRAAHDEAVRQANRSAATNGHATNHAGGSAHSARSDLSLKQFLATSMVNLGSFQKIFIAPNIPLKKLSGALESYGGTLNAADVVVLVDDTLFGGSADGILVTEDAVLMKEIATNRRVFSMLEMKDLQISANALYINGRKLIGLNMPDAEATDAVFSRIREYASLKFGSERDARPEPSTKQASAPSAQTAASSEDELPSEQQLFSSAKAAFGELYRSMHMKSEGEEHFANLAVEYFKATEAKLSKRKLSNAEYNELGLVYLLATNITEIGNEEATADPDLLDDNEDDGDFVEVLRLLLRHFDEWAKPAMSKRKADQYFGRR
jgi:curved DNA-binding protein CbpA